MQFELRAGRTDDWDALCRVFVAAGRAAWDHILSAGTLEALSAPERWRFAPGTKLLVADSAGEVLGFVCVRRSHDEDAAEQTGEVDAFYTHPSVWGSGIGRALLAAAVTELDNAGFLDVTLWTEHRNHRPLRIYREAGWQPDGAERRRSHGATELLEIRMRFALRSEQREP